MTTPTTKGHFKPKDDAPDYDPKTWDATATLDTDDAVNAVPAKDFTFPGMDQGTCGVLAGAGGTGKSYILLQLMLYISTGFDSLGISSDSDWGAIKRRRCVYFCFEDRQKHIKERIFTVGRKLASLGISMHEFKAAMRAEFGVQTLTGTLAPNFLAPAWQRWLDDVAADAGLVVVDTTRKTWNGNENDSGEVNELLSVFDGFSIRTGCSVLLTVHINKFAAANGLADTAAATRGSSAFNDNGRANFYLRRMTQEDAEGTKGGTGPLVDYDRQCHMKDTRQGAKRPNFSSYVLFGGTKQSYSEDVDGVWFRRETAAEIGAPDGFGGTLGVARIAPQGSRAPAINDPGPLTTEDLHMLGAFRDTAVVRNGSYKGRSVEI